MAFPLLLLWIPQPERTSARADVWRGLAPNLGRERWTLVEGGDLDDSGAVCAGLAFLPFPDGALGADVGQAIDDLLQRDPEALVFELHRDWVSYARIDDWPGRYRVLSVAETLARNTP